MTVTDWIEAGSSSAAAIGTVGSLWIIAMTYRKQWLDERRRQARRVTALVAPFQHQAAKFIVMNNSEAEVFNLVVVLRRGTVEVDKPIHGDFLVAGTSLDGPLPEGVDELSIEFSDADGVRWHRDSHGQLIEKERGSVRRILHDRRKAWGAKGRPRNTGRTRT